MAAGEKTGRSSFSSSSIFSGISANVLVLGLVSFLTDVSSEMIYPLLPLFLTSVLGAGPAFLGMIEGIAESTSSFLKLASGIASDRVSSRKGLVLFGYGLSALARPLVAIATVPGAVLGIRFADRIGKGVRTSPRDALIADTVDPAFRGKAFGFHRSLDHAGAIIGPLLAAGILALYSDNLRTVFLLSAIPGAISVLLIITKVRDVPPGERKVVSNGHFLRMLPHGKLRTYLLILFLFTLGNSSDAFLLLKATKAGVPGYQVTLLWTFFHLIKMSSAMPFGALSDRVGRRGIIVAGWVIYSLTYVGFSMATSPLQIWTLFAVYGLYYGLTEGVEKALLTDIAAPEERGGAFGWYNFAVGVGALPASVIFGLLWERVGEQAAFLLGAGLAIVAAVLFLALVRGRQTSDI